MEEQTNKLRILMCSEASFLNSGFGNYTRELLNRLYDTDKYVIAEFASYGYVNDVRDKDIRWIYYANAVKENDNRYKEYSARTDNQFGKWRFEKVLLDFKPDVVIDIRDYWMSYYQSQSPLRSFFHWILMPTVDSEPQQEEWISTFLSADAIFTYSDWGAEVLKRQSNNKINYVGTASPGINLSLFKPLNKSEVRKVYGIPESSFVIGSVMRNQKRKLIPELMSSFKDLLSKLKKENSTFADKTFLYLHTSYPDMGWDIPELLKNHAISNKVFFTYLCRQCGYCYARVFGGPQIICPQCKNSSSCLSSVSHGVSEEQLSHIYNIFDIYVQYAICEGFGMPQVEAGACGVPIATVNYSAMCDVVNKLKAYPIRVQTFFKELETKALRVYPDNNDLVDHIARYMHSPQDLKNKRSVNTRKLVEKYYNWDNIAKIWESYLDKLHSSGYRANWNKNIPMLSTEAINRNENYNVDYLMSAVPNTQNNSYVQIDRILDTLKNLDYGFIQNSPTSISNYTMEQARKQLELIVNNHNTIKHIIQNNISYTQEDFIQYAKLKQQL